MKKKLPALWRLRAHPPTFDWAEARRRAKRGESHYSIARDLGVDRRSVDRVVKMSPRHVRAAMEMTDPEARAALIRDRDKDDCPRCGRPKSRSSQLCQDCRNDVRLDEMPMEVVPIPGIRKIELRNVAMHRIVKVGSRWGVICSAGVGKTPAGYRVVDFWEGGREYVHGREVVQVAPATAIVIGGEVQEEEAIA